MANFNTVTTVTTASNTNSISFLLREEGLEWGDIHTPRQGVLETLVEAKDVMSWEFNSRRYPSGGALFVTQGLITLDWDDDDKEEILKEVLHYLHEDISFHPSHVWELQETNHGFHAVLLTDCQVPHSLLQEWGDAMGVDPLYLQFRKDAGFDWRVTPKFEGDMVCEPYCRIGSAEVDPEVEELLEAYYTAVEWCKEQLEEDPDFLEDLESEQVDLKDLPWEEDILEFLDKKDLYEWDDWGWIYKDPFFGRTFIKVCGYATEEDWERDWWSTKAIWRAPI